MADKRAAVPHVTVAALMGAAVLAGVGAGLVPDIASSSEKMVHIRQMLQPDPQRHEQYSRVYAVYKRLYPDLRNAFHQLSALNDGKGISEN